MSGVGEASLVLGIISSIISIVTAAKNIYDAANDASGLPKAFHNVAGKLPIVVVILKQANEYIRVSQVDQDTRDAFVIILTRCETSAKELGEIFGKVLPKDGASRVERYFSAAKKIGKGGRVEDLITDILKEIGLLLASSSFATQHAVQAVEKALKDVSIIEPSLPDDFTSGTPRIKTLQQVQYADDQAHQTSADPKSTLYGWLLPSSTIAAEHDTYLQKRFHNPNASYASFQWFFETAEYRKLLEVDSTKVLRVKGSPGCGKSVLTASVIHHLKTSNPGANSRKVLYCYCSRDPEQTTSMTLVRTLLAQTLEWATPEMLLEFKKPYSAHPVLKLHDISKVEDVLWRLLRTVLGMREQKTFIVVDGIDDCVQPLICIKSLIKITASLATKAHCGLLLSSRLERRDAFDNKTLRASMVNNGVECCQLVFTEELTRRDLSEYVSHQVSTRPSFLSSSPAIRDKIITSVCNRANGMFLYASLILEDLKGETISSIADIDLTLASLPADLFKSYENNLQLPLRSRRGPEAFRWILFANPSLTWHELQSAFAIGEDGYDNNKVILDSCDAFIDHTCGPLVEAFGDTERLRFIHQTVTEFLVGSMHSGDDLDLRKGDAMIASKLLTFLEYPDLPSFSSPIIQSPEETIQEYSAQTGRGLYTFATLNWYKHLKKCDKTQNQQLEVQVRQFLQSKSFVRWLKTAIIMSRISRDGRDSASLTADIVDSLQSWSSGRHWCLEDSQSTIQSWINHFLDLMLDWGKVIETQPDWIHYLHQQLLPSTTSFRDALEEGGSDQSIIQFDPQTIRTKRLEPITWPSRCFAMDLERDLAFTYDEPFISSYHIKTGLMNAEILVPIPSKIHGPLEVRRGLLCPQGKYLAILFEATDPSIDPIGDKIRGGRRLQLNMETTGFKWAMDDASVSMDISGILAHMAIGVSPAEFVVCLLELNHNGPARSQFFGLPSWATSPVLLTGVQTMRWNLDDVDVLRFSNDSSKLFTSFGILDIESGKNQKPWQFALGQFYQGGKVTHDLKTFVTVLRDIEGGCIVQFFNIEDTNNNLGLPSREIRFSGVVHLLAVSNHGRFLLLTRRDIVEVARKMKTRNALLPTQQASVGVWDCRDGEWTPLLLLDREFVNKLPHWNFLPYIFEPSFGPEAMTESEMNRVLFFVPSKWKLSGNVRKSKPLDSGQSQLLIFESKKSMKGFGKNPSLKLQLPSTAFSFNSSGAGPTMKLFSWNPAFDRATVYQDLSVAQLNHEQLRLSGLSIPKPEIVPTASKITAQVDNSQHFSALIMSSTGSAIFYVHVAVKFSNNDTPHSMKDTTDPETEVMAHKNIIYEISVACLLAGEEQARTSSVKYTPSSTMYQPLIEHQLVCSSDENFISLGNIELEVLHHEEEMSIIVNDRNETVLQQAIECFKHRSHPLQHHGTETSTIGFVDDASTARYIIFAENQMSSEGLGTSFEDDTTTFVIKGETSTQDSRHVFQVSRPLRSTPDKFEPRESSQSEVCLFIYDEDIEDITWMIHTTTGGDMRGSREPVPETAWALHNDLPLLAWLLPGHRLRISNIEGHGAPVSIAESLSVDVDLAHAVSFSASGRYLAIQAQESFKNDIMSLRRSPNLWGLVLCDIQEGLTIGANLISDSPVSIVLQDDLLHTYRVTRDGAVESTTYTLPGLTLSQRLYLTFIPDGCCCSTCGKGYDSECKVTVIENEGGLLAILGHTEVGLGKTSMKSEMCQPLMIRITTPPVEININGIRESIFVIGSKRLFPAILDDQGQILENAFSPRYCSGPACSKEEDSGCSCSKCLLEAQGDSLDVTWIPQMETKISDFKLPSGLPVPPEQIEELHRLSEQAALKSTCIWKNSAQSKRDSIDHFKFILGEEIFPWDSWAEFKEAMEEIKEIFDHEEWMNRMFEPGNCGSGCQIPLFVHTFYFGENRDENDFQWSSATTTGWLEEDLVWYYERFFGGSFEGARRWYMFPAYKALGVKMEELQEDKTAKGKRFRRYFGPRTKDKNGKVLKIEAPAEEQGKDVFEKDGMTFDDEMKPMVPGLIMKDVFESMSDLVPGLGKVFEQRMHTMLSQSMIADLMD